jgi:hypothetical protein
MAARAALSVLLTVAGAAAGACPWATPPSALPPGAQLTYAFSMETFVTQQLVRTAEGCDWMMWA